MFYEQQSSYYYELLYFNKTKMFDEEIHSNSEWENEIYENFKFRQMIKELSEDIADSIVDFLDSNKEWCSKK